MLRPTDDKTLDIDYAEQMRRHPFGTALYQPQPRDIFHPGMVGYFDTYGNWNPITDLLQEAASSTCESGSTASFTPPNDLPELAVPEKHEWGPKLGTTTRGRRIDVKAGVSEALMTGLSGVPLGVGSCYRFESEKSTGAVLITKAPVVHERFYFESPFKLWVASNAARLLAERAELKKHALWVVTSTWASDEVAINCWQDSKRAVEVGFKASFVQIGELAPKGEWADGGSADGWMRVKGDAASGGGRVVFFGGLKFKYRPIIGGLGAQDKRKLRGDGEGEEVVVSSLQADDGGEYALSCEEILEQEPEIDDD